MVRGGQGVSLPGSRPGSCALVWWCIPAGPSLSRTGTNSPKKDAMAEQPKVIGMPGRRISGHKLTPANRRTSPPSTNDTN